MKQIANDENTINPNGKQPIEYLTKKEADEIYAKKGESGGAVSIYKIKYKNFDIEPKTAAIRGAQVELISGEPFTDSDLSNVLYSEIKLLKTNNEFSMGDAPLAAYKFIGGLVFTEGEVKALVQSNEAVTVNSERYAVCVIIHKK